MREVLFIHAEWTDRCSRLTERRRPPWHFALESPNTEGPREARKLSDRAKIIEGLRRVTDSGETFSMEKSTFPGALAIKRRCIGIRARPGTGTALVDSTRMEASASRTKRGTKSHRVGPGLCYDGASSISRAISPYARGELEITDLNVIYSRRTNYT